MISLAIWQLSINFYATITFMIGNGNIMWLRNILKWIQLVTQLFKMEAIFYSQ